MAALFDKGNLLTGTQPVDSALSSTSEFPLQNKVIKQNFDSITTTLGGKVNTSDIKNNLTSTDTDKPLSAYQGKVLDDKITTVSSNLTKNCLDDFIDIRNSAPYTFPSDGYVRMYFQNTTPIFTLTSAHTNTNSVTFGNCAGRFALEVRKGMIGKLSTTDGVYELRFYPLI